MHHILHLTIRPDTNSDSGHAHRTPWRTARRSIAALAAAMLVCTAAIPVTAAELDPPPSPAIETTVTTVPPLTVLPPRPGCASLPPCLKMPSGGSALGPRVTVHLIFWAAEGTEFLPGVTNGNAQYISTIERFFTDLGGSRLFNIVTQYPDGRSGQHPVNSLTLGGTYMQTRPYPNSPLMTDDIDAEIRQMKIDNDLVESSRAESMQQLFFVYTPAGVTICTNEFFPQCSGTSWAGLHSYFIDFDSNGTITSRTALAVIPPVLIGEGGPLYPNGELIDQVLSTTAHELFEAYTNPIGVGYRNFAGEIREIGDLCRNTYGWMDSIGANTYLNGNPYQIQYMYSNDAGGCANGFDGQFITLPPLPPTTTANPPFSLAASATSQLPVSYAATGPCAVVGTQMTVTGAGVCTITASQPGNKGSGGFYDPATPVSRTVAITDVTPPVATPTVSPAPNAAGWNNTLPVSVAWNWADADSGINTSNCTASTVIGAATAEGTSVVQAACADLAGNPATAEQTLQIDTTRPVVSVTGVADGATYAAGGMPVAECSTVDGGIGGVGSGVATPASAVTSGGPTSFVVTCDGAVDVAGNAQAAPVSVSYMVDATAPSLVAGVVGTSGTNGWYVGDVTVSWSVTDTESAVTASTCPSGSVTTDTVGTTFGCTATSTGGTSTASVVVKRDATRPTAAVTGIAAGSYGLGTVPTAGCSTSDAGGSQVATGATLSWTPTAPTTAGSFTATCAGARDGAGNLQNAPATITITVTSTVANRADVSTALSCPATMRLRVEASCTLTVRNTGPATATGVIGSMVLPRSLSVLAVSGGGTLTLIGVYWRVPSLAPSTSMTWTVSVRPVSTGTVAVGAAVLSTTPDPSYGNNLAAARVVVDR